MSLHSRFALLSPFHSVARGVSLLDNLILRLFIKVGQATILVDYRLSCYKSAAGSPTPTVLQLNVDPHGRFPDAVPFH